MRRCRIAVMSLKRHGVEVSKKSRGKNDVAAGAGTGGLVALVLAVAQVDGEGDNLTQTSIGSGEFAPWVAAGLEVRAQRIEGLRFRRLRRSRWSPQHEADAQAAHAAPVGLCGGIVAGYRQLIGAQELVGHAGGSPRGDGIGRDVVDPVQNLKALDPLDQGRWR